MLKSQSFMDRLFGFILHFGGWAALGAGIGYIGVVIFLMAFTGEALGTSGGFETAFTHQNTKVGAIVGVVIGLVLGYRNRN